MRPLNGVICIAQPFVKCALSRFHEARASREMPRSLSAFAISDTELKVFGNGFARFDHGAALPISVTFFSMASRSKLSSRKHVKRLMRRCKTMNASRNALRISSSEPVTAAGSGTPSGR